jgi:hypothetical protein
MIIGTMRTSATGLEVVATRRGKLPDVTEIPNGG